MSTVNEPTLTSPELVLLAMMLENDYAQAEADKETRDAAREQQLEAMEDELDALEEQADAIRTGAMIEGSMQVAGGTLTVIGSYEEAKLKVNEDATPEDVLTVATLQGSGEAATGLAKPMGDLLGRAEEKDAEVEAKQAQQDQELASWTAEDAEEHRQKAERRAETMLEQAQGILETQHQTTVAVLANI